MQNKIKSAFDNIHAGDNLKSQTITFIESKTHHKRSILRPMCATFACLALIGFGGYKAYLQLKELGINLTSDEVKQMSMREINDLISSVKQNDNQYDTNSTSYSGQGQNCNQNNNNGHHQYGKQNGHHNNQNSSN